MKLILITVLTFFMGVGYVFVHGNTTNLKLVNIKKYFFVQIITHAQDTCAQEATRASYFICMRKVLKPTIILFGIRPHLDGLERALERGLSLELRTSEESEWKRNCHELTHAIGQTGGMYMNDLRKAAIGCTDLCGNGCHHGILEGRLIKGGDLAQIVPQACSYITKVEYNTEVANHFCYHGLGHGISNITANLEKSLELCDLTPPEGKRDCARGTFMELYSTSYGSQQGVHLKVPKDIIGWCNGMNGVFAQVCWEMAGTHVLSRQRADDDHLSTKEYSFQAMNVCREAPMQSEKEDCAKMLGHNMFHDFNQNIPNAYEACDEMTDMRQFCILGLVHSIVEDEPSGIAARAQVCELEKGIFNTICTEAIDQQVRGQGVRKLD